MFSFICFLIFILCFPLGIKIFQMDFLLFLIKWLYWGIIYIILVASILSRVCNMLTNTYLHVTTANQEVNIYLSLKCLLCQFIANNPTLILAPRQQLVCFLSQFIRFACSRTLYKWSYSKYSFCLALFTKQNGFEIHPCCGTFSNWASVGTI